MAQELTDARRRHDEALPHDGGAALVHALRGLADARVRLEAEVRRSVLEFQEVSVGPGPNLVWSRFLESTYTPPHA